MTNPKISLTTVLLNEGLDPIEIEKELDKYGYVLSNSEFELARKHSLAIIKLDCTLQSARWAATHGITYKVYRNKFFQGRFIVIKEAEYNSLKSESINHTNY